MNINNKIGGKKLCRVVFEEEIPLALSLGGGGGDDGVVQSRAEKSVQYKERC